MDEAGLWRLSPAYDLTYIIDTGGYLPNTGHCMYVRSKLHHISYDDAIQFAKDNGIGVLMQSLGKWLILCGNSVT